MRPFLERCIRIVFIVTATSAAGCAGTELLSRHWHKLPRASEDNPVVRILCIWEPAEGTGLDGLPTRGFAGQIFFFTAGSPVPVKVDGDVRVYLFDDYGSPDEQAKPIHQFDFLGDAWTIHLHKGALGPSYHVFIPYVRKHPYRANCGLRVRLKPQSGPALFSDTVHVTLPGPTPDDDSQQTGHGATASLPGSSRPQNTAEPARNLPESDRPQGASLTRETIPLTALVKKAHAAKDKNAEPEKDKEPETGDRGVRNATHSTPNADLQTSNSENSHPLRFKLQPAEPNFGPADGQHPLAEGKPPTKSDQLRRAALRRHPLADQAKQIDQAEDPAHRHPLAEDTR